MEDHKPPFLLKEMKIEVTHDCMLHCIHCSSISGEKSGRSMDWGSCKTILDDAAKMGVENIAFSGGEPLLWKHIPKAINCATQHGMISYIYTSGNAPNAENILKKLHNAGLQKVVFSIFGPDSEQHETVTLSSNSYNKTISVVEYCVAKGMDTEFHFVPFSNNLHLLRSIANEAHNLGVRRVSILRLVPQGRGADRDISELNHNQNLELRNWIKELRDDGHEIRLGSPYNFLMLNERPKCCSGIDRLTIGPNLNIYPCDAFKHITPNDIGVSSEYSCLDSHSLDECWEKSHYLNAVRNYLNSDFAEICSSCKMLSYCGSGCLAQKFYAHNKFIKCPDPMCLLN